MPYIQQAKDLWVFTALNINTTIMSVIELNKMAEYAWSKDYLLLKKLLDEGWTGIIARTYFSVDLSYKSSLRGWYEYRVGGMPITMGNLEILESNDPSISIEEKFERICEKNEVEFLIPDNYESR